MKIIIENNENIKKEKKEYNRMMRNNYFVFKSIFTMQRILKVFYWEKKDKKEK